MGYHPIHRQVHATPEAWVSAATDGLIAIYRNLGYEVPEGITVKPHLSFPHKGGWQGPNTGKGKVVGMAYHETSDPEGRTRHFLVTLALANAIGSKTGVLDRLGDDERECGVLDVIAHELAHTIVGNDHGHDKVFTECIRRIGLAGKPTATYAGKRFVELTADLQAALGVYPHKGMSVRSKVQDTRLVKVACTTPQDDGSIGCDTGDGKGAYNLNMTRKWLDDERFGAPYCPCCGERMEEVARKVRQRKTATPAGA